MRDNWRAGLQFLIKQPVGGELIGWYLAVPDFAGCRSSDHMMREVLEQAARKPRGSLGLQQAPAEAGRGC